MYNRIKIENYKNLKCLELNNLGRVNLLTGKNNTGKSSLLEAIALLYSDFSIEWISKILTYRGEDIAQAYKNAQNYDKKTIEQVNKNFILTLFNERLEGSNIRFDFTTHRENKQTEVRFTTIVKRIENQEITNSVKTENESLKNTVRLDGLKILHYPNINLYELSEKFLNSNLQLVEENNNKLGYIFGKQVENVIDPKIWDVISLSENAEIVIDALKIIEPKINRLAFIETGNGKRKAMVKLLNKDEILPLQTMGDGLNRILSIILRMVNSENGIFLLDEFENGLHYTVQEQLWKVIFELSKKLNIQVFATTHSQDCIYTFSKVLNDQKEENMGKVFRLENKKEQIIPIEYTKEELIIAAEQNIEIR